MSGQSHKQFDTRVASLVMSLLCSAHKARAQDESSLLGYLICLRLIPDRKD